MGRYHFIAIGGVGMSGLAKYLIQSGNTVSGSDIEDGKYLVELRKTGAEVFIGHDKKNVPDNAVVVVSSAIREDNPELVEAKKKGLKIFHRSDLLAEISEHAKNTGKCFIGFSGMHGKTTTSGLASYVLSKAGLKPAFVVGGIIPDIHTNALYDEGQLFTAELDESDGTIVKYSPDILVINNLEPDHLDFYKNGMSDIINTFTRVVSQSKKVIVNADNEGIKELEGDFITYGLADADYIAKNISYTKENTSFDVYYKKSLLGNVKIRLSGVHNVYNTLAVISALSEAGVNISDIIPCFSDFTGMGRRFQKVCEFGGIEVYDDYAHHPTEIKATLSAACARFGKENVVAVFQPHRFTRLQSLWNEFKTSFDDAERVFVTDVYSASEDPIEGISGENFAKTLEGSVYISGSIDKVSEKLLPYLKSGDVVIGLGAGTVTNLGKYLEKAGCLAN